MKKILVLSFSIFSALMGPLFAVVVPTLGSTTISLGYSASQQDVDSAQFGEQVFDVNEWVIVSVPFYDPGSRHGVVYQWVYGQIRNGSGAFYGVDTGANNPEELAVDFIGKIL